MLTKRASAPSRIAEILLSGSIEVVRVARRCKMVDTIECTGCPDKGVWAVQMVNAIESTGMMSVSEGGANQWPRSATDHLFGAGSGARIARSVETHSSPTPDVATTGQEAGGEDRCRVTRTLYGPTGIGHSD